MPVYISQEILDKIISCATDSDPGRHFLCRASLVSHTFRQIVLPYKFKSLTFRNRTIGGHYDSTTLISITNFCEAINTGDAYALSLAPLVQELSLICWNGGDAIGIPELFEKVINNVFYFRNLTKLEMQKCVTSPAIMEQLGKLVQLQSLHTWRCQDEENRVRGDKVSYGALSNLQSLHTLECEEDWYQFQRGLACIPVKNLRILKSSDLEVIEALLITDPPVQLKQLWLTCRLWGDHSFLWNYIARATSLTHLSLPYLQLSDDLPPFFFPFQNLQYLHIHVAIAPRFADQPLKEMRIETQSELMAEVRQHWQGVVFPHVEYLETDRLVWYGELDEIPIEFWREFLLNVKEVR